jgi:GTP 3',8-cyclase
MPACGVAKLAREEMLSFEQLHRIAEQAVRLGVEKIRVTGGEPLARKGVTGFLERLAVVPGLKELALTTNGLLLREMASDLYRAGVQRLNVSVDSLKPETYSRITRGGVLAQALDGIAAAERAGFAPVKINMVVMRGVNDDEVLDFAALTLDKAHSVRFIEYMPTGVTSEWKERSVSGREMLDKIKERYSLEPVSSHGTAGPAQEFRIAGAAGTVGVITPISNCFCASCNRIRVTATGMAKGCLFGKGVDLKPYLRLGDDELRKVLREVVLNKPAWHGLTMPLPAEKAFPMAHVGG